MTDVESDRPFLRGDVVSHPAPFKGRQTNRYFVVLSDESHPFNGEEYLVAALTSREREYALGLGEGDWRFGSPPGDSFVSPWYLLTVKHADVDNAQGSLTDAVTDRIASHAASYLGAGPADLA